VQRGWSIFFGAVLLATFLIWFVSPAMGWWLPDNVSSYGGDVDYLFYVILGFTGFFFVLTISVMVYALYAYAGREGEKATYTHGNHRLEILWTAVPAGILLFIAFAQIRAWEKIKYQSRFPPPDLTVQVTARQWEWRMRYPADNERFGFDEKDPKDEIRQKQILARNWAEVPERDDVHIPNEIHCWKDANVKVYLKTVDVIHSFTIPNLRIKQDTLPGKTIPMWFKVNKHNTTFDPKTGRCSEPADSRDAWEIACQELCGGRHYAMRGRLYVHETRADYEAWLAHARKSQESREVAGVFGN